MPPYPGSSRTVDGDRGTGLGAGRQSGRSPWLRTGHGRLETSVEVDGGREGVDSRGGEEAPLSHAVEGVGGIQVAGGAAGEGPAVVGLLPLAGLSLAVRRAGAADMHRLGLRRGTAAATPLRPDEGEEVWIFDPRGALAELSHGCLLPSASPS